MLNDIGRICVKIAGRDAGKKCIIVDILDENYVLIDGNTRRKKCNISHLEPTEKVLDVKKGVTHDVVIKLFEAEKLDVKKESKLKKSVPRLKKQHINRKENQQK